jgi:hypothetical protein
LTEEGGDKWAEKYRARERSKGRKREKGQERQSKIEIDTHTYTKPACTSVI